VRQSGSSWRTDAGQDYFEERYRERVTRNRTERASKLGLQVLPAAELPRLKTPRRIN
jgi:hypothetical protein